MRRVKEQGKCLQCGSKTNIILDAGEYACKECLNKIREQQNNVFSAFLKLYDDEEEALNFLRNVIILLEIMELNGHEKTRHCIESLKSFDIILKADENLLQEFIEKNIDLYESL